MNMAEKILKINGVDICAETFGSPSDPCLLLIMGASASMIWWDDEFCRRLASEGLFVIRYDNRDTGRSTCYDPGALPYTVMDMAADAVGVLDAHGVVSAHFAGMSLGGMIAQIVAITRPERVKTITLIASSVWDDLPHLPPIAPEILAYHSSASGLDWSDRAAVVKYMVGGWKILNGTRHPFDEPRAMALAETEASRARNLLSMINHALLKGGEDLYGRSKQINTPVLIIHGTKDPVLPYAHAEELCKTIPGAKLLTLEGAGHEIHRADRDEVIDAIKRHIKDSRV